MEEATVVSSLASKESDTDCSCGRYYGTARNPQIATVPEEEKETAAATSAANPLPLDTSFVHLPPFMPTTAAAMTPRKKASNTNPSSSYSPSTNQLFTQDDLHYWSMLERAMHEQHSHDDDDDDSLFLCLECTSRLERALHADADRLEHETRLLQAAAAEQRVGAGWTRAAAALLQTQQNDDNDDNDEQDESMTPEEARLRVQQGFEEEIESLQAACEEYQQELVRLRDLARQDQQARAELRKAEAELEEDRNALELEARAFDNDEQQLYKNLAEIQQEVDRLSSSEVCLASTLLNLQVDKERGLRYPLINELRLAYRPKGDVHWNEIQASWSLAAQLLLVVGTLLEFQSDQWKIIPLSNCAKLIYRYKEKQQQPPQPSSSAKQQQQSRSSTVVYNLGHPKTDSSRALMAWNALLYQVVQHAQTKRAQMVDTVNSVDIPMHAPFGMTATAIGNVTLQDLRDDAAGWSRVIHYMACNLQWTSQVAEAQVRLEVLLRAWTTVGS